jgi:hypothetical protein
MSRNAANVFIRKRGQLRELSSGVDSVILTKDFLQASPLSEVLSGLILLRSLATVEIEGFCESENDRKKLEQISEGLSRLSGLRNISVHDPLSTEAILLLSRLSLTSIGISVLTFDQKALQAIGNVKTLQRFFINTTDYLVSDLSPFLKLSELASLSIYSESKEVRTEISRQLRSCGLVQTKRFTGIIGEFYETGKEVATREFLADDEPLLRDYALRPGDRLEIFESDGDCVFDSILDPVDPGEGRWLQRGIEKETWHQWFTNRHRAAVSTELLCLPKNSQVYAEY